MNKGGLQVFRLWGHPFKFVLFSGSLLDTYHDDFRVIVLLEH